MRGLGWIGLVLCAPLSAQVLSEEVRAGLTSEDPATILASVEAYTQNAASLELEDLRPLSQALNVGRTVRFAAPELQRALEVLGREHPDPMIRMRVRNRAQLLDTFVRQVELRRHVEGLFAEGVTGVALMSAAVARAVELNLERGLPTNAAVIDGAMFDLGVAIHGSQLGDHLDLYDRTFGLLPGSDPLLEVALAELGERRGVVGYVGNDLDAPEAESDFRDDLHDGTRNQVHHTGFFVNLGYVVGLHDPTIPHVINLRHETLDPGSSVADWRASAVGIGVGQRIRALREADGDPRQLPAILGAAFSDRPEDYTHPWGPDGPDYSALVAEVAAASEATSVNPRGDHLLGRTRSRVQEGLIRGLNWVSGEPNR
ncbi:MAG: hypothetical protein R3F62_04410 [Planctomycetota bacterium]